MRLLFYFHYFILSFILLMSAFMCQFFFLFVTSEIFCRCSLMSSCLQKIISVSLINSWSYVTHPLDGAVSSLPVILCGCVELAQENESVAQVTVCSALGGLVAKFLCNGETLEKQGGTVCYSETQILAGMSCCLGHSRDFASAYSQMSE